jgi:NADH-quinone oxidoreductase subunit C
MTNEAVLSEIQSKFGAKIIAHSEEYGMLILEILSDANVEIMQYIKENASCKMTFLTTLCGIHYPEKSGKELCVMYQLHNMEINYRLRLKAYIPISNPKIKSVSGLFASANWQERQEFDFYGIEFEGHPDLRRILNMDEMDYHPMRKEYPLEDATRHDKIDELFGR